MKSWFRVRKSFSRYILAGFTLWLLIIWNFGFFYDAPIHASFFDKLKMIAITGSFAVVLFFQIRGIFVNYLRASNGLIEGRISKGSIIYRINMSDINSIQIETELAKSTTYYNLRLGFNIGNGIKEVLFKWYNKDDLDTLCRAIADYKEMPHNSDVTTAKKGSISMDLISGSLITVLLGFAICYLING